ncbi:hypothetical protein Tco_1410902 [Tanacetum coccineum]
MDVEQLFRLVKERYSSSAPEGFDLMLWGDLHTLFEPDEDDEIWKDQHEYNLLSWRLHDFCGIHILLMNNGLAIHMLTEKKYPLSQEMLSKMLSTRLEVDHESSQAFELLRFIRAQGRIVGNKSSYDLILPTVLKGLVLPAQVKADDMKIRRTDQGVGSTSGIRACALRYFDLGNMELENSQNNSLAKLPILKLGEYEMWEIRIKQYFQIQDYALWEVIYTKPSSYHNITAALKFQDSNTSRLVDTLTNIVDFFFSARKSIRRIHTPGYAVSRPVEDN